MKGLTEAPEPSVVEIPFAFFFSCIPRPWEYLFIRLLFRVFTKIGFWVRQKASRVRSFRKIRGTLTVARI